jgi:hypothetical protein
MNNKWFQFHLNFFVSDFCSSSVREIRVFTYFVYGSFKDAASSPYHMESNGSVVIVSSIGKDTEGRAGYLYETTIPEFQGRTWRSYEISQSG